MREGGWEGGRPGGAMFAVVGVRGVGREAGLSRNVVA